MDAKHQELISQKKEIWSKYTALGRDPDKHTDTKAYRYILLRGNNDKLIKRVMETRQWWQKIQHTSTIFDFKWSPFSSKINFDFLGKCGERSVVNHFDGHQCLSNKD